MNALKKFIKSPYFIAIIGWLIVAQIVSRIGLGEAQAMLGAALLCIIACYSTWGYNMPSFGWYARLATASIPANIISIILDTTFVDPTSHNLLPFEVLFTFVCAFITCTLAYFIVKVMHSL